LNVSQVVSVVLKQCSTPFGLPVVPDVKHMRITSSGDIVTRSASSISGVSFTTLAKLTTSGASTSSTQITSDRSGRRGRSSRIIAR
jgi:hypothetical protein